MAKHRSVFGKIFILGLLVMLVFARMETASIWVLDSSICLKGVFFTISKGVVFILV